MIRKIGSNMSSTSTLDRGLSLLLNNPMSLHDDPLYQEMLAEKERLLVPQLFNFQKVWLRNSKMMGSSFVNSVARFITLKSS